MVSLNQCVGLSAADADQISAQVCELEEQLLRRNVKRFRGELVVKAHGPLHHSDLGSREIREEGLWAGPKMVHATSRLSRENLY